MHVVLFQPEIPPNTANVGRLCAGTGVSLHLIRPLGFELSARYLDKPELAFWSDIDLHVHDHFDEIEAIRAPHARIWLFSSAATTCYWDVAFGADDILVFGRETAGLPQALKVRHSETLVTLPHSKHIRSVNLSNAVSIAVYEALRQQVTTSD